MATPLATRVNPAPSHGDTDHGDDGSTMPNGKPSRPYQKAGRPSTVATPSARAIFRHWPHHASASRMGETLRDAIIPTVAGLSQRSSAAIISGWALPTHAP